LRDLVRYRKKVVAQAAADKNRILKILEDGNVKLSSVLSNVDGSVGTKIIDKMIDGVTDIDELMKFYHGKIKVTREEFRLALEGHLTAHHRLMLQLYKESISDRERLIKRLDAEIEKATAAYQVEIDLLQSIPGVGKDSAITIISETGVDMDKFPDEHHLSSWSGMSPGNNESGGKKKRQKQSKATRIFKVH
jgi:transposase